MDPSSHQKVLAIMEASPIWDKATNLSRLISEHGYLVFPVGERGDHELVCSELTNPPESSPCLANGSQDPQRSGAWEILKASGSVVQDQIPYEKKKKMHIEPLPKQLGNSGEIHYWQQVGEEAVRVVGDIA